MPWISRTRLAEIEQQAFADGEETGREVKSLEHRDHLGKLRDLFPVIDDYVDTGGYFRLSSLLCAHSALTVYRQHQHGKQLAKAQKEGAN